MVGLNNRRDLFQFWRFYDLFPRLCASCVLPIHEPTGIYHKYYFYYLEGITVAHVLHSATLFW